jgi:CubicO group peptidase (beta-lactamase class C family)
LFREHAVWNEEAGLRRLVEALAQTPLAFQPGTDFRYSFSSDVLGRLLENVAKQPLDEILRRRVFDPLQMIDSGFYVRRDQAGRLTSYYAYEDGRLVRKEPATNSPFLSRPKSFSGGGGWPDGHAGLLATATDWWRLCEMIRNRGQLNGVRVLKPETVGAMVTNQLGSVGSGFFPNRPGRGYGLSLGVIVDREQAKDPGSNGQVFWAGGPYNTYFFIDSEQQMVGILLLQTGPFHHLELMSQFNELAHRAIAAPAKGGGNDGVSPKAIEERR